MFCNYQFVVKVWCCFLAVFCLIPPNFHISSGLLWLQKLYACSLIGGLFYLFQHYVRARFSFMYKRTSSLFSVLDFLDFSVPFVAVLSAVAYAVFLKRKIFLLFYNKFIESDNFLGKRYSNIKKVSFLLLVEFLSLSLFDIFYFYVLTYLVDQNYEIHFTVPKHNICYYLTTSLFLFSICSVRLFIVLIRTIISNTNKKLTHNIETILSFTYYKQLPSFVPHFEIYPYLVQYQSCFELIRFFNNYFGLQVLIISCASFVVLINNMYLSSIQLQGTILESIPPYLLFFRHIVNSAMYMVSL